MRPFQIFGGGNMGTYDGLFKGVESCGESSGGLVSLEDLGGDESSGFQFPSLDALNESCASIPQSRDFIKGVEEGFNAVKDGLKFVLDPLTEPLSWALTGALVIFENTPWFIMIPVLLVITWFVARSIGAVILVAVTLFFYAFVDIYEHAMQTLGIVLLCTFVCVLFGVPIGIAMSKRDWLRDVMIPVLDLLQTLPSFVYLVPLIMLFSVTAPKLYGIAIILYAIVPVIRLTNLGIRLVDKEVIEAANAFGMTRWQKLFKVEIPLSLPNIMAGVNQTVMMSLAMVVIASMVSAPGLGKFVLRAIRNVEIGYGIVYGIAIVLMAVCLDRVSKAALNRINAGQ